MEKAEQLTMAARGALDEQQVKTLIGKTNIGAAFDRVVRAHCQIVVLERELTGLREAPHRGEREADETEDSDEERPERLDDRDPSDRENLLGRMNGYNNGPLDLVVADIRKAVGDTATPGDDPFAPPPERRARPPRAGNTNSPRKGAPGGGMTIRALPAKPARNPVAVAKPATAQPILATPAKPGNKRARLLAGAAIRSRGPPR